MTIYRPAAVKGLISCYWLEIPMKLFDLFLVCIFKIFFLSFGKKKIIGVILFLLSLKLCDIFDTNEAKIKTIVFLPQNL